MIENMFENLLNKNVNVSVAFNGITKTGAFTANQAASAVTTVYTGIVTGYNENFIVLSNNLYISIKYIQTIQVIN